MFNTLQWNHASRNFSENRLRKEEGKQIVPRKRLFHDLYVLSTLAFDQSAREKLLSYR